MSKVISPIVFRSNYFNTYINKQFLSFDKKFSDLNYFKFFNIYINLIFFVKRELNLKNNNILLKKYLYSKVNNINISSLTINFIFEKLYKKEFIKTLKNIFFNIIIYFNYFKKFKFYGNLNKFFILKVSYLSYYNLVNSINKLKFMFTDYKKFKKGIIFHCKKVFKYKYKRRFKIIGIKVLCSGRLNKFNNRSKIDIYSIGTLSLQTIYSKFYYFTDVVNTDKGSIGLKIWINIK